LVAERPRHSYDLERVIAERGVREWTALGFSSIYYVLNKLESRGLVSSERPDGRQQGRRTYSLTSAGVAACVEGTRAALEQLPAMHSAVLVGLANSPLLAGGQLAKSLRTRHGSVASRVESIRSARSQQEPLETFVGAIFDHGIALLQAELGWIEATLATLKETTMQTFDIKKERKDLYGPKSADFAIVEVPPLQFLMVDGHGDPNTSSAYREAVEALYTASYGVRAAAKANFRRVHTVGPLEGLWSADDPEVFQTREKSAWDWTLMIVQPDWITAELVDEALTAAGKKQLPALELIRFERYSEGRCVQILHLGSYDDEGPTLARMHAEYLPVHGLSMTGRHHEIYLSDARKTEPARLRTILRQPVSAGPDGRKHQLGDGH
jgi:DNA-binding PadR family transcriptional regulator